MDKKIIEKAMNHGMALVLTVERHRITGLVLRTGLMALGTAPSYYAFCREDYLILDGAFHNIRKAEAEARLDKKMVLGVRGREHGGPFGYIRRVPCYVDADGQVLDQSYLIVEPVPHMGR